MKRKIANYILLGIGAVFLFLYPFVFFADVMTLAGERSGFESPWLVLVVYGFVIISGIYPIVYLTSFILYLSKKNLRRTKIACIPLVHVFVTILVGFLWSLLD